MFTFLYVSIDLNIYNVCITYLYSGHFMPHTVAILSQYLYFSRCKVTVVCAHRQENKCFSAVCRLIFDLCQRIVCVHTNILCLLPCMTVRCGCPHGSPCAFALRLCRARCRHWHIPHTQKRRCIPRLWRDAPPLAYVCLCHSYIHTPRVCLPLSLPSWAATLLGEMSER